MKHDQIASVHHETSDSTAEKKFWEKPEIIVLDVKETFGSFNGVPHDGDRLRS